VLAIAAFLICSASVTSSAAAIFYSAPPSCPSAAEFVGLAETGTKNYGEALDSAKTRRPEFVVEIVETSAGTEGRVRRKNGAELTEPRIFSDAQCRPVAEALALTLRLSLTAEAPPDPVSDETPEATLTRTPSPVPVRTASAWAVGGGLTASGLLPPHPLTGVALLLEHRAPLPRSARAPFRPDLRLTMSLARNDVLRDPGSAEFSLLVATIDACPLGMSFATRWGARLCGFAEAGAIQGKGITVDNPRTARSFWGAAGALARFRLAPTAGTFLEFQGGAVLPLHQMDYVFEMPRIPVADGPRVTWTGALVTGVTIP
jgi:hypothetical protein